MLAGAHNGIHELQSKCNDGEMNRLHYAECMEGDSKFVAFKQNNDVVFCYEYPKRRILNTVVVPNCEPSMVEEIIAHCRRIIVMQQLRGPLATGWHEFTLHTDVYKVDVTLVMDLESLMQKVYGYCVRWLEKFGNEICCVRVSFKPKRNKEHSNT